MTLELRLTHAFPGFKLDLDLTAPAGLTCLFGRSGSGKTTIINAVAGLLRPDTARIVLDGVALHDLPPHQRRVGYVFQDARLFPHLTVAQNLTYAARIRRQQAKGFDRIVGLLGIGALLDRRPATLSGGERQRVAIGRALLSDPRILLMDEPLAALDEARKAEILPYIEALRDAFGLPILYVSHALPEVARLATSIAVIDAGRLLAFGPAARLLSDPETAPLKSIAKALVDVDRIRALGAGDLVIGLLGVPHAKAIMVLGGQGHVANAGLLHRIRPRIGIEIYRVELLVQRPVVRLKSRKVLAATRPAHHVVIPRPIIPRRKWPRLAAIPKRIWPPMQQEAKLLILEPLKPIAKPLRLLVIERSAMGDDVKSFFCHEPGVYLPLHRPRRVPSTSS